MRYVLHVDLDQFIAAVEVLRRPELAGRPVVVGGDGDPTKRGVVSTASYEARAFGVHSGLPLRTALKRCPDAVFLPVDADAYLAASRTVMDTVRAFSAVVEVMGWDEAFLEATTDAPERLAREVQRAVLARTALWCSVGIGDNKLRAKLATGFAKPAGVFMLTAANWTDVMAERSTSSLWGVGAKTAARLRERGVRTVRELAGADERALAAAFGRSLGPWLGRLARGDDETPVRAEPYVPKGRGIEHTYQQNLTDPDQIRAEVARLAHKLAGELPRPAVRVVVKVRYAPFRTVTRGLTLPDPTSDGRDIEAAARSALDRLDLDRPVRLLGVRAELVSG